MLDVRRLSDAAVSALGIAVLSPVLALVALAVKLDSPGPAFFGHERVGRNFQPFKVWKFRTMSVNHGGPQITAGNDPRITRIGHRLRSSKIDELPQLFNVLKGEMSLVGPRPEVAEYVELFRPTYETILKVRPGLTDPASVHFKDEQAILAETDDPARAYVEQVLPKKLELSSEYVANRSMASDWRLVVKTVASLIKPDGRGH